MTGESSFPNLFKISTIQYCHELFWDWREPFGKGLNLFVENIKWSFLARPHINFLSDADSFLASNDLGSTFCQS